MYQVTITSTFANVYRSTSWATHRPAHDLSISVYPTVVAHAAPCTRMVHFDPPAPIRPAVTQPRGTLTATPPGPGPATARVTCPSRRAALAADADAFVGNAVVPAPSRERALANIRLRPTTVDVIHPDALAAAEGHAVTPAANYRSCALYPTAQLAADHTRVLARVSIC